MKKNLLQEEINKITADRDNINLEKDNVVAERDNALENIKKLNTDLEEINNSEINFQNTNSIPKQHEGMENYSNVIYDMNRKGKWSNFYRNATNIYGKSIGNHQVKKINLKINDFE